MSPKISVIVPVYKVEQYLSKCIDSILAQTFTDFELLLIDDGSPDRSGEVCDEYAAKDSRIRVFHKENGGVSSARNIGLDNANGEWIVFVDSDDWVENKYFESFWVTELVSSILLIQYYKTFDDKNRTQNKISITHTQPIFYSNKEFINGIEQSCKLKIMNSPYCKLFCSTIIQKNNIRFNEYISYGEDFVFSLSYCQFIDTIVILPQNGYIYRKGVPDSLTTKVVSINEGLIFYDLLLEISRYLTLKHITPIPVLKRNLFIRIASIAKSFLLSNEQDIKRYKYIMSQLCLHYNKYEKYSESSIVNKLYYHYLYQLYKNFPLWFSRFVFSSTQKTINKLHNKQ